MKSGHFAQLCRICPQMRDYYPGKDYFPGALSWTPYTMFFNRPLLRCASFETDGNGVRLTRRRGQVFGLDAFQEYMGKKALLVGSSFVFGVGASEDKHTIASCLSEATDTLFLNLGGRSHNSTQEIINILLRISRFPDVNPVVILSGINNLELFCGSTTISDSQEWLYFQEYMLHSIDLRTLNSWLYAARRWALRAFPAHDRAGRAPLAPTVVHPGGPFSKPTLFTRFKETLQRDFAVMSLLAQRCRVIYALQPFASWVRKAFTVEELELFELLNALQPPKWMHVLEAMTQAKDQYAQLLRQLAMESGIEFLDLNDYYREPKWYFVDRVHMNDDGYAETARLLLQYVLR